MAYGIGPPSYLERAKRRLEEKTEESLFYAALELRSYLESRQDQYLDAQRAYAKSFPSAWETSKQWKSLRKIFKDDKIQHLAFKFEDGWAFDAYHVPVTETFRKSAEKLSDLLHAQSIYRAPGNTWWEEAREKVVAVYRSAWICQQGNLLCPALIDKDMIKGRLALELPAGEPEDYKRHFAKDQTMLLNVNYLAINPSEWIPDL
ncbi:hypothetical protein ATY77_16760 [Rhizobium sp. R634]|uniref:hypothetical protein n=1 Tax=Rhizobium sp. R634 TaxID=1764274 RepID=UPI000B536A87|nr:hypothetical protein [Rhizobium sp. R634]OWV70417.1 hypothetical protein ATY77_16760 [Rhizobium sp. R634]